MPQSDIDRFLSRVGGSWVEVTGQPVGKGHSYDETSGEFTSPVGVSVPVVVSPVLPLREFKEIVGLNALKLIRRRAQTDEDLATFWDFIASTGEIDRSAPEFGPTMDQLLAGNIITQAAYDEAYPADLRAS